MAERLTDQLTRLSYTRRDLELIDEEIDKFITYFIPTIKNTGKANVGRLFIRILEALVDKLNYSLDMRFRQSVLRTVKELQAALDISEIVRYNQTGVTAATATLTISTLKGPAPAGGIAIAQYSIFATNIAPTKFFLALEAYTIPAGSSSISDVQAVEGTRSVDQVIKSSADGNPSEEVRMSIPFTPHEYLEVKVDSISYSVVQDFRESTPDDRHVMYRTDENGYTTVVFGDGEYGRKLSSGSVITATYIQCSGEEGNAPAQSISRVTGALAATISVVNPNRASGGFDGDILEDVIRKAPLQATTFYRAAHTDDFAVLAETQVDGVYQALAEKGDGTLVKVYIMPNGGGIATPTLLADVESYLNDHAVHGTVVSAEALLAAPIWISMSVLLKSRTLSKSVARGIIYETISAYKLDGSVNDSGALYYRNLKVGRGFAFSDVSALLENINNGELVDYVDFTVFTRYPTPIASNLSTTVYFDGNIVPLAAAEYSTWSVQALTTTTFAVFKDGIKDGEGTVGTEFTSSDNFVKFKLGTSTDTLSADDTWTFVLSSYRNNMLLSKYEFMELAESSDLDIRVYYPGEYEIGE